MAFTKSGAHPQSLITLKLPSNNFSSLPFEILYAVLIIFLITKVFGLNGDSWLNKNPVEANIL